MTTLDTSNEEGAKKRKTTLDYSNEEDAKKGKTTYRVWTAEESNFLLKLLVDAVGYNWRDSSGSFGKKLVETRILPALNKEHNCTISYSEYLSRWKFFQRRYCKYEKLMKFSSGFGFDSTTKRFVASDEVWDNYFKSHPKQRCMKYDSCDDYEDLLIVVGNKTAIGKSSIGLNFEENDARVYEHKDSQHARASSMPYDFNFDDEGNFTLDDKDDSPPQVDHEGRHASCERTSPNIPIAPTRKRPRKGVDESAPKDKDILENMSSGVVSVATNLEAIRGLMEEREKEKKNTCFVAIMEMPELTIDEKFKVVGLLDTKDKKEMFKLLSPEERKSWVFSKLFL